MRRYTKTENGSELVEMTETDMQGKEILRRYLRDRQGRQATVARRSGISTPVLSKMANQADYRLNFEAAVLIEVATDGELKADQLCPARADALAGLLRVRGANQQAA